MGSGVLDFILVSFSRGYYVDMKHLPQPLHENASCMLDAQHGKGKEVLSHCASEPLCLLRAYLHVKVFPCVLHVLHFAITIYTALMLHRIVRSHKKDIQYNLYVIPNANSLSVTDCRSQLDTPRLCVVAVPNHFRMVGLT